MLKSIFGKTDPREEVRKWTRLLRSEMRKVDMQITKIQREEQKVKASIKLAAKKNDTVAMRILAKELIHSRRAISRMYTARTQMNSVSMHLQNTLSQARLTGSLQKSAEVMKQMNGLTNVKEVRQSMLAMSKEMSKAGLIDGIINDTLDEALDGDISDTELDEEVSKVVADVLHQQMEGAHVGTSRLSQKTTANVAEEDAEDDDLLNRLNALRD